jgi:hypothetical protein
MALNKKQKKQIDVSRKKLVKLHQLVASTKQQLDDPEELVALQKQIQDEEAKIESIKNS